MKLSIVMATYNGARFLTEQLDSLRTQTRPAEEVLIQDDGSTDNTRVLVKDYIRQYGLGETWRLLENETNLGYAGNFRTAALRAAGDVIFFCDQDDIWHEDKLEKVEKAFAEHPAVQVLCSRYTPFVTGETFSQLRDVSKEVNDGSVEQVPFTQKHMFLDSLGCAMALRREFLDRTKKYWYPGLAHDEYAWKLGLCVDGLYWYNESLLDRRHHSANVSMRKMRNLPKRIVYLHNFLKSYETMTQCLQEMNDKEEYRQIVSRQVRAARLRIGQMERKQYGNSLLLLGYWDTYQTVRTIPMELYMSVFRKKFR